MKNTSQIEKTSWQSEKNESTGNYTNNALLYLQNNKVDVIVGAFHPTEETDRDFDGSFIIAMDTLNIVAPKSGRKPIWLRVIEIYSWKFGFTLIICLTLFVVFVYYFYNIFSSTMLLWLFQILTDSPVKNIQNNCTFRVAMSFLLIFCLINSTAFKNSLELIYFSNEYHHEIETEEDLRNSGLELYTYSAKTMLKYQNSDREVDRELASKMVVCKDIIPCLQRIAVKKDIAMLYLRAPIVFAIPKHYMDPNRHEPLLYVGETLQMVPYQMMFKKNYPPFEDINDILTRISETGLFDFEESKKVHDWYLTFFRGRKLSSHVIKFNHLEIVFLIWAFGVLLAVVVFFGEFVSHYFNNTS